MTQTVSLTASASTPSPVHPRLTELLESGGFDWDDPRHREAYLKAWLNAPRKQEEEPRDR